MTVVTQKSVLAKPFLKWAGGKGQLLDEIDRRLPVELTTGRIDTYIEPFIGGGAVFFYVAPKYETVRHFYLFDINEDIVNCYNAVKHNVEAVIAELEILRRKFLNKHTDESRRQFYMAVRRKFNIEKDIHFSFATAAKLIFLNKTCYNGLYRVNNNGHFNVPFGGYKNPKIYDSENLTTVSHLLQQADIICGDFEKSAKFITQSTFVYLDPPYRPISPTASFTTYSKSNFTEHDQIRLAEFCRHINAKGAKFLLSNSDPQNENLNDHFFEDQYKGFAIDTVKAARAINCKAAGRGQINELLITNFSLRGRLNGKQRVLAKDISRLQHICP